MGGTIRLDMQIFMGDGMEYTQVTLRFLLLGMDGAATIKDLRMDTTIIHITMIGLIGATAVIITIIIMDTAITITTMPKEIIIEIILMEPEVVDLLRSMIVEQTVLL